MQVKRVEVNQQDHRGEACRCVVSVVHLGWADPVRGVVLVQMLCQDVALCPVVAAAQECREVPVVSKV